MTSIAVDTRNLPAGRCHEQVFGPAHALKDDDEVAMINDHDPQSLHDSRKAMGGATLRGIRLERGPQRWRLQIAGVSA